MVPSTVKLAAHTLKVAVVLPVYNTVAYLRECLNSLFRQTHEDFVIFAVDDGSSDGSGQILDEYATNDKRLHVTHKTNAGVSVARNIALEQIESDGTFGFVCFVDSDDYVSPDFFRIMIDIMVQKNADYAVCAGEEFDKSGIIKLDYAMPPLELLDQDGIAEQFFRDPTTSEGKIDPTVKRYLSTRFFKASKILGARFNEQFQCGGDQEYFIRLLLKLHVGVQVPEILHFYRLRSSSVSHSMRATVHSISVYENYYFNDKRFTSSARKGLELMLIDMWWTEVRRVYEHGLGRNERNYLHHLFARLTSKPLLNELSQKRKRRFILFRCGDWFLKLYFHLRWNKNVASQNRWYFE